MKFRTPKELGQSEDKAYFPIRMPTELKDQLSQYAAKAGISLTALIVGVLEDYLAYLKEREK